MVIHRRGQFFETQQKGNQNTNYECKYFTVNQTSSYSTVVIAIST